MKLQVFSVFDEKGGSYGTPIFVVNRGVAVRSFSDAVLQEGSEFAKHAGDYKLYCIGNFDNVSGALDRLSVPEFICHAVDFVKMGV